MAASGNASEYIVQLTNIPDIFGAKALFALVARRLPSAIRTDGIKLRVAASGTEAELICKSADVAAAVAAKLAHPIIKVSFTSDHGPRVSSAAATDGGLHERRLSAAMTNSASDAAESSSSTADGAKQTTNPWRKSQVAPAPAKSVATEPAWRYYRKGRSSAKARSAGKAGHTGSSRGSKDGGKQRARGGSDVNAGAKRLVVNSLGGGRAAQRAHDAGVAAEAGRDRRVRGIQQRQDRQQAADASSGGAFSSSAFGSTRRGRGGGRGGSRRGRGRGGGKAAAPGATQA